ncbi:MAG: HK97 family phage prohead protease [Methylocystis sp.]|nr:HK97 family phage prohead protease [Methylocystis sp.]
MRGVRSHEIKRVDFCVAEASASGLIEGYASLFGVIDDGGDMVMRGAFARSLKRRGAAGVKMLWQHKATEPIGVWTSIVEDARGLKATGRLDLCVARAREALSLMRKGAVDGLSIGFKTLRASREGASGVRKLFELDLWEISIVTFPMLTQARIGAVKRREASVPASIARVAQYRAALDFEAALRRAAAMPDH